MQTKNSIFITAIKDPFDPYGSRLISEVPFQAKTVAEYIDDLYPEIIDEFEVVCTLTPNAKRDLVSLDTIPLPGQNAVFTLVPKGDSFKGNQGLRMVASIALLIATIYMPELSFMKGLDIGEKALIQAGVAIAGSLIINAILPIGAPDAQQSSASYSWSGVNVINEGTTFPVIYGVVKIVPPMIGIYMQNQWNDDSGGVVPDTQRLGILCALADHSITSISDIKINGSDYSGYPGVSISTRTGAVDQSVIPNFRDTHTQQGQDRKLTTSDWVEIEVPGTENTAIGIGLGYPNGLGYWNEDGNVETARIYKEVQYSLNTEPRDWQPWIKGYTSGAQASAMRLHYQTDQDHGTFQTDSYTGEELTPGEYVVRVRTNDIKTLNDRRWVTDFYIDYIEGIVKDDFRYPGASLLAIDAVATDQLSGGIPSISAIVSRGTITVYEQDGTPHSVNSNNPAWACYDVLNNLEYGCNVSYSRILYSEFAAWASFCSTNGYEVNIVFDTSMSVPDALARISLLGRGRIVQRGTKFGVIIDQTGNYVQMFGMGNIVEGSIKVSYLPKSDRANVIETTYWDASKDYEERSFELRTSGFDTDTDIDENKLELQLYGCTSKTQALELTQFMLNCNEYLIKSVEFEVGVDALGSNVGDIILVSHDSPDWGESGHVVSATSNTVTIDRKVTLTPGTTYHIIIRRAATDTFEEVELSTPGVETTTDTVTLASGTWSTTPVKDDIFSFGEVNYVYKEFRITKISRTQDMIRKINAIEYIAGVYSDAVSLPDYPDDSNLEPFVAGLRAVEVYRKEDGIVKTIVSLSWRGFGLTYVFMKEETAFYWKQLDSFSGTTSYDVRNIETGKTYYFAVSTTPNPGDGVNTTITVKGYTPPRVIWPVTGLEIEGQGNNTVFNNRDLKLHWNLMTTYFPSTADGDVAAGVLPNMTDFGGYHVQIYDYNGNLRREFVQLENRYEYTYEKNSEDGYLFTMTVSNKSGTFVAGEMLYQYPSGAYARVVSVSGTTVYLSGLSSTAFVAGQVVYQDTYGSNVLVDGDCEASPGNWTVVGDASTNERSTEQVHGGTYSRKVVIPVTGGGNANYTAGIISIGDFFILEGYIKITELNAALVNVQSLKYGGSEIQHNYFYTTGSWESFTHIGFLDSGSWGGLYVTGGTTTGQCTWYEDDFTLKKITNAAIAVNVPYAGTVGSYSDPESNLVVKVWARDKYGQESDHPAIISVSNPAPSAPSGLTLTAILKGIQANWLQNNEVDVKDGGHYRYRTKVETNDWSDWADTPNTSFTRVLTTTEQDDFGVDATIYVEVKAVDSFGNDSSASSSNKDAQGLNIKPEDIIGELVSNIELSDSDSNPASTLLKLYDGDTSISGISYSVSGTDKYIEYSFPIQEIIDRVSIWCNGANAHVYVAYSEDGDTWNYLSAESDHNLTDDLELVDNTQGGSSINYWQLASGKNAAKFPDGVTAQKCRLYLTGSFTETVYELIFVRSVQAEQVIATELAAIVAVLGSVASGSLESLNLASDAGIFIDLDNEAIQFGGTRVNATGATQYPGIFLGKEGSYYNAFLGDPDLGYLKIDTETGGAEYRGNLYVLGGEGKGGWNLVKNGDFEKDNSGVTAPTDWTVTYGGTPSYRQVWLTSPSTYYPPWNEGEGAKVFYGACDDASENVKFVSDYYIPVDITKHFNLAAYVRNVSGTSRIYLGLDYYQDNAGTVSAITAYNYPCMESYAATSTWTQKSAIIYPNGTGGGVKEFPSDCKYVKIRCFPQYQAVGGSLISRIQFVQGLAPIEWPTLDGGSIYANTIVASHIKGNDFGDLTISSGSITISASSGLVINATEGIYVNSGTDITLLGTSSNPGLIKFKVDADTKVNMGLYSSSTFSIKSNDNTFAPSLIIGDSTYPFGVVSIYGNDISSLYSYTSANAIGMLQARSSATAANNYVYLFTSDGSDSYYLKICQGTLELSNIDTVTGFPGMSPGINISSQVLDDDSGCFEVSSPLNSNTWNNMLTVPVYIFEGASYISGFVHTYCGVSSGGYSIYTRFGISGSYSGTDDHATGTLEWYFTSSLSLDISSLTTGWYDLIIQNQSHNYTSTTKVNGYHFVVT